MLVGLASSVISASGASVEKPAAHPDQRRHIFRLHQAGRAAAEEDRADLPPPQPLRLERQLAAQGRDKARLGNALPDMRIEIAIRAFAQAKRPMDVECEAFHVMRCIAASRSGCRLARTGYRPIPNRMDAVAVQNLTKRYKHTLAVDNISFTLPQGGVLGLLGGNGAGKTTTISMLLGLLVPTSGSINVLGHDMAKDRFAALARMNFSSPYIALPQKLTVHRKPARLRQFV